MKLKKWISMVLTLSMVMLLLAACGTSASNNGSKASNNTSGNKTTSGNNTSDQLKGKLTVWTYFGQVKTLAAQFEKQYPGIQVDVKVFPGSQYKTKLMTAMQSGQNVPDIFDMDLGYIGEFINSPYLADLSAMGGDKLVKNYVPYVAEYGRSKDGKLRAISDNSSPGGYWYVRSTAKKYLGTDDPQKISTMVDSWDKINTLGKQVAQKSNGKVHLIQDVSTLFDIMGSNTKQWVQNGKLVIDPKWKTTYATQQKLRKNNVDAKQGFMSSGWGSALNDGSVVLTAMPTWATFMISNKNDKAKGKFGVAKTPLGYYLGGRWEAIYKKSPNKKLAYAWMKYISSEKWQTYNLNKTGNMPSNEKVFQDSADTYKSVLTGDEKLLNIFADQMKSMPKIPADKYNGNIQSLWVKVASHGIDTNESYDTVVQKFKKEVKGTYPELNVQ